MVEAAILNKLMLKLLVISIGVAQHTLQQVQVIKCFKEVAVAIDRDNLVPVIGFEDSFSNQIGIIGIIWNIGYNLPRQQ
jgi:hypothetical protein